MKIEESRHADKCIDDLCAAAPILELVSSACFHCNLCIEYGRERKSELVRCLHINFLPAGKMMMH